MTTKRETAKIYQFPIGGRVGLQLTQGRKPLAGDNVAVVQTAAPVVMTDSWYHDDAVRDAELARKR